LLNLEQKNATLEQEKLQLRIQKIQAQSATLVAQAELKKVEANKDASPEELQAAALKVEAAIATEQGLQQKGQFLDQQGILNQQEAASQLAISDRRNITEERKARLELANARVKGSLGRTEKRELRKEALSNLGVEFTSELKNFTPVINVPTPTLQPIPQAVPSPTLQPVPQVVPTQQLIIKQQQKPEAPKPVNTGNITVEINNNFTNQTPRQVADDITGKLREELYSIGLELTRKK
jgi:hypothetical protein